MTNKSSKGTRSNSTGPLAIFLTPLRVGERGASFFALVLAMVVAGTAFMPAIAQANFGLTKFDVSFTGPTGEAVTQAGVHPYQMVTAFEVTTEVLPEGPGCNPPSELGVHECVFPSELAKDLEIFQVPGFVGNQTAVPKCPTVAFLQSGSGISSNDSACASSAAVGLISVEVGEEKGSGAFEAPVYNLEPAPGEAAKLGFTIQRIPITIGVSLSTSYPYELHASSRNISQALEFFGGKVTLWGMPADPRHDPSRGHCYNIAASCAAGVAEVPFLTMPRACQGPLATRYEVDSWQHPGVWATGQSLTHDSSGNPKGMGGCGALPFAPTIGAQPTSRAAESSTGLDFALNAENEGLTSAKEGALAASDIRKTVVTLPEGMTANPSSANGLGVCTEAQLAEESSKANPAAGCPDASKLGTIEVESPLIDQKLGGSLYLAKPYENPFGTLIALYMVFRNEQLGIFVEQPLKVEPDPTTGRLVTTAEDLPQLPFSHFRLHFREGARSPLVTPPACGTYQVEALLYPSSGGAPVPSNASFEIISGSNGSDCPTGGLPAFKPELLAGTESNAAGAYSPFYARISRTDAEQEITHFSIKLPPGVTGKLAGIPFCTDAQIAAATAREGQPSGGEEELASPSCPAASEVGHTLVGAGVGSILTWVPGKVYLAGPYHGSALSIVAITSAVAGPFDLGTVVVREALRINPETAEVFVDATGSDPIPHIIRGIPVHLRDIRVYVDRQNFVLNPTSCEEMSTAATVLGSGLDFVSEADDNPFVSTSPFQAADCAALAFRPNLKLRLLGGTKRRGHPKIRAVLRMRGGEANVAYAQVTLPHSAFLDQSHIRTVCTRVQFKAGAGNGEGCPKGSIYGHAKAITPLLDEPLSGPVFLRSSEHKLPDLVAALHSGKINIDLVGRIDSLKGRIRNTFEAVPDAPVSKFVLTMQGAKKGLIVNQADLCQGTQRAIVAFKAHNGKVSDTRPKVGAKCPKGRKKHKGHKAKHRAGLSGLQKTR